MVCSDDAVGMDVDVGVEMLMPTVGDRTGVGVAVGAGGVGDGTGVSVATGVSVGAGVDVGIGVAVGSALLDIARNSWPSNTSECPHTKAGSLKVGFGWNLTGRLSGA